MQRGPDELKGRYLLPSRGKVVDTGVALAVASCCIHLCELRCGPCHLSGCWNRPLLLAMEMGCHKEGVLVDCNLPFELLHS